MSKKKPNIVFILTDQLRHDFLGCYGADFLKTPAIDSLASNGTRYETCISPSPTCVPARASMLTGLGAHETGVVHNLQWLRPDRREMGVTSWPEHLNDVGYHSCAIGKMHFYPWDITEGFQNRIIAEDKRHIHIHDDYYDALKERGFEKLHGADMPGYYENKGACISELPDDLHVDRWVGAQAVDYISDHDFDTPLALMVGFPGPHCPYDPPQDAVDKITSNSIPEAIPSTQESDSHQSGFLAGYKREWAAIDYEGLNKTHIQAIRRHYAAAVERIDQDVADILKKLTDRGELENTIIIFTSDHGDLLGDFDMVGKGTFHEPSIRVPMIVTDYRKPEAKVSTELTSLIDLFPSFLKLSVLAVPAHLSGIALGEDTSGRVIIGLTAQGIMARDHRWKLVKYTNGMSALFDLQNDPEEQENLLSKAPDQAARLDAEITKAIVAGAAKSHADKLVNAVKAAPPHAFYDRDWQRPYPSPTLETKLGS